MLSVVDIHDDTSLQRNRIEYVRFISTEDIQLAFYTLITETIYGLRKQKRVNNK